MKWSGGSTLSVHRAFVVHLGAGGPGRRRLHGRVEHLSSGRTAHFASLKDLLAFFAAVLEEPPPGGPPEAPRRGAYSTAVQDHIAKPPARKRRRASHTEGK